LVIRDFAWDDYDAALALWDRLAMTKPNIDNRDALRACLARNPGLFLVADDGAPARLVGTVIGTFDGRRGYLYHVAVDPDWRRRGIGRALVKEALRRLWALGAPKVTLRVHAHNHEAIAFYRMLGLRVDDQVAGVSIERKD
jgi:ribosomal protein S18 acetylase RimI-like enzyme